MNNNVCFYINDCRKETGPERYKSKHEDSGEPDPSLLGPDMQGPV